MKTRKILNANRANRSRCVKIRTKGSVSGRGLFCTPSMGGDLEVRVLRGVGRSDPSKPQGELIPTREGGAEGSGERIRESTNRNRIEGHVEQGERAE